MKTIHTAIIGGGQAGLAMSRCLTDRGIEHLVFERGRVAERWRSERWDSLRLLTPNWQTRLPGFRYEGPDPDGFMDMPELIAFLERYAVSSSAPVLTSTAVRSVGTAAAGFVVSTSRGEWIARNVVIATGYSDRPYVPPLAAGLSRRLVQVTPDQYRNPAQLPPGGVLVVGASATGIQLADEIHASGRDVTLAVGRHLRLPRTYRGRDILWWLDAMGVFDDTVASVPDIRASRSAPSLQLVGRADRRSLDLAALQRQGVRLAGRLIAADGTVVTLDDEVIATTVASDLKLAQLRARIDAFIERTGLSGGVEPPEPFEPTWPAAFDATAERIDLEARGIRTILWATGFRRKYPWLKVPVLDRHGEIRHRAGVTPAAGLYVLGLHFQRRRKSAFIDGVGDDARYLAEHIAFALRASAKQASPVARRTSPLTGDASWPPISLR